MAGGARPQTTRPLSVCVITGEYPPALGGVADYTALLAQHLAQRGLGVSVLTTRPASSPPAGPRGSAAEGVGVGTVGRWGLSSRRDIAEAVAQAQADIVHLQYQTAAYSMSPAINFLPLLLRACGVRAPFVTTFHDLRGPYLFPKAGRLRQLVVHALVGFSDVAIFPDPLGLARARPRRTAAWIPIGPNVSPSEPADRTAQRQQAGISERQAVVAYFGLLNASKGVDTLLRAAERLVRAGLDLRLLFVGDELGASDPTNAATAQQMRALAAALGLEERILRTGRLTPPGISAALAAADLAALPFADGASLRRGSLLACLAHGLPVVTTLPTAVPDVPIRHRVPPFDDPARYRIDERSVVLVPPGDDGALASEIYRLVNDPPRMEALSRAGRALADRLAWPSIAEATATVYRRALSNEG